MDNELTLEEKIGVVSASTLSDEHLKNIAEKNDNPEILEAIAKHQNASAETLELIANKTDNEAVLKAVSENDNAGEKTLEKLSSSENSNSSQAFSTEEKSALLDFEQSKIDAGLEKFMENKKAELEDRFGEGWENLKVDREQKLGDVADNLEKRAGAYAEDNGFFFSDKGLESRTTGESFSNIEDAKNAIEKTVNEDFKNMETEKFLTVDAVFERSNMNGDSLDQRIEQNNHLEKPDIEQATREKLSDDKSSSAEAQNEAIIKNAEDVKANSIENSPEVKSVADIVDVAKDGKFDNDAGKQAENELRQLISDEINSRDTKFENAFSEAVGDMKELRDSGSYNTQSNNQSNSQRQSMKDNND